MTLFFIEKTLLKPTRLTRILSILENIRLADEISQNEQAKRSLISGTMIYKYLKELQDDELVKATPIDGKRLHYELTQKGEKNRRDMLGMYMAEIVQIYSALKEVIKKKLEFICKDGVHQLVLFCASTTCEVVLSVMYIDKMKVIAIVDNDPEKQGNLFCGYVISPPEILTYLNFNAILITSFARYHEIKEQLNDLVEKRNVRVFTL